MEKLQALLPNARVLYSSATGASEPANLAYMTRLGCWGFQDFKDMIRTLNRCACCNPRHGGLLLLGAVVDLQGRGGWRQHTSATHVEHDQAPQPQACSTYSLHVNRALEAFDYICCCREDHQEDGTMYARFGVTELLQDSCRCSSGLGSLELYSMGLKATGTYVSRTLSYSDAEFSIANVAIDPMFMCGSLGLFLE